MRHRFVLALALFLPACGAFDGGDDPLERRAAKLGEIRSGTLDFRLAAEAADGSEIGFEMNGPFSVPEDEGLPEADLRYATLGDTDLPERGFISDGEAVYIELEGQAYELPVEMTAPFQAQAGADTGPLDEIDITAWISNVKVDEGASADGVDATEITGDLDVVQAVNDLFELARTYGSADVPTIEGEEAERLEAAVDEATVRLVTGAEDDLMRALDLNVKLASDAPRSMAPALQDLLGVSFELNMTLNDPNGEVDVDAPPNPLPFDGSIPIAD